MTHFASKNYVSTHLVFSYYIVNNYCYRKKCCTLYYKNTVRNYS